MMSKLRSLATPLTIGSFITLGVTGLCMLAGYRQGLIDPLHELSSIVFVAASVLHIIVNWKPVRTHLRRPLGAVLAACFVVATAFALIPTTSHRGSDPRRVFSQAADALLDSDLQGLAKVTQRPEPELVQDLVRAGFSTVDPSANLRAIARANQKSTLEILAAVLPEKPAR